MFSNPKTTIPGILLLVAALATVAAHAVSGTLSSADWQSVLQGLVGLGLIGAADGSR